MTTRRDHQKFWFRFGGQTITIDLVGTMAFAIVDGRRVAASRAKAWQWVSLTGGRHAALLRELNRSDREAMRNFSPTPRQ